MDRSDFDTWVWQVGPALHRTGFLLTGDWERSRELVLKACVQTRSDWEDISAPEAYARSRMARDAALEETTSEPRGATQHDGLAGLLGSQPAEAERRRRVMEALDSLTAPQRTALVLQYYDGLTEEQIAIDLEWSPATVSALIDEALDAFRARGLDDGWV